MHVVVMGPGYGIVVRRWVLFDYFSPRVQFYGQPTNLYVSTRIHNTIGPFRTEKKISIASTCAKQQQLRARNME